MQLLELKIPPPIVAVLIAVAMWYASSIGPSIELPLLIRSAVFTAIASLGGAVALAGDVEFKRARTTINPLKPQNASALVTSGVYRYTRNPMYLGLLIVLLGWCAFLSSGLPLLGPFMFVGYVTRFQIIPEERVLLAKFGSAYSEFVDNVRRWL